MREEIANLVYPVLTEGIRLKERLAAGDPPEFATAQKTLLGLLQSASHAQRFADFGGDRVGMDSVRSRRSDQFLGIRYALVCWLDEIFISDSAWNEQWQEHKLETELYQTNDRAWKFWEQADWASARPTTDALEVFFLCVMLGFRGDKGNNPDQLQAWCERVKAQVEQSSADDFHLPVEGPLRFRAWPLHGAKSLQNMLVLLAAALLLAVPPLTVFLVLQLRK